jgi:hypothetical protein
VSLDQIYVMITLGINSIRFADEVILPGLQRLACIINQHAIGKEGSQQKGKVRDFAQIRDEEFAIKGV